MPVLQATSDPERYRSGVAKTNFVVALIPKFIYACGEQRVSVFLKI